METGILVAGPVEGVPDLFQPVARALSCRQPEIKGIAN